MCALGHTLTFLFLKTFSWKLKKLSLLFQFSRNFFPKMEIMAHISKIHNQIIKIIYIISRSLSIYYCYVSIELYQGSCQHFLSIISLKYMYININVCSNALCLYMQVIFLGTFLWYTNFHYMVPNST